MQTRKKNVHRYLTSNMMNEVVLTIHFCPIDVSKALRSIQIISHWPKIYSKEKVKFSVLLTIYSLKRLLFIEPSSIEFKNYRSFNELNLTRLLKERPKKSQRAAQSQVGNPETPQPVTTQAEHRQLGSPQREHLIDRKKF